MKALCLKGRPDAAADGRTPHQQQLQQPQQQLFQSQAKKQQDLQQSLQQQQKVQNYEALWQQLQVMEERRLPNKGMETQEQQQQQQHKQVLKGGDAPVQQRHQQQPVQQFSHEQRMAVKQMPPHAPSPAAGNDTSQVCTRACLLLCC